MGFHRHFQTKTQLQSRQIDQYLAVLDGEQHSLQNTDPELSCGISKRLLESPDIRAPVLNSSVISKIANLATCSLSNTSHTEEFCSHCLVMVCCLMGKDSLLTGQSPIRVCRL